MLTMQKNAVHEEKQTRKKGLHIFI